MQLDSLNLIAPLPTRPPPHQHRGSEPLSPASHSTPPSPLPDLATTRPRAPEKRSETSARGKTAKGKRPPQLAYRRLVGGGVRHASAYQVMDAGGGGLGGFQWTAEEASTIGGIATVSLLHSFIPTHWLPFSIVGRAQRWPLSRTLLVTAFGAVLHVVSTALLGITAVTMANTIAGEETVHKLASLLLIFLGAGYILLFALGKGGHSHAHNHPMEKMAVAGLVLVPALSPCATTLPVFLAVGNSSSMMILAIIVLLFSTITVMTSLVALSFYGASQIKFHWVERYDKVLVGSVLCLVGVLTYVFHHHDGDEHSLHAHVHRKLVGP
ncbi:uncharacterized protein LOC119279521 [Triticum dicoccoides]|uniref:uncharacterized protein LOC119279521 n=1 Tax=Triticum dicoccoides TaxID=85692 RepID=UPI00188FF263|nr:uncharacterized protein LOC119279521 [Triticum dicoccoides]